MTNPIDASLTALGTIAFALPGPWGPVASAALHLVQSMIDPDDTQDANKIVLDQIKASTTEIESFVTQQKVKTVNTYLASVENWLKTIDGISDLDVNPASVELAIEGLEDLNKPWSDPEKWVAELEAIAVPNKDPNFSDLERMRIAGIVHVYVAMAMLRNYRVIMQNKLVLMYQDSDVVDDNQKVRDELRKLETYYDEMVSFITTNFTTAVQTQIINACSTAGLMLINRLGSVEWEGHARSLFWPHSSITYYVEDKCTPARRVVSKTNQYNCNANNRLGIMSCSVVRDLQGDAVVARAIYAGNLMPDWSKFGTDWIEVINKARDLFKNSPGEPAAPSQSPDVDVTTATAWPKAWQFPGKYVRYQVGFQSARRSVNLASPWSKWQQVQGTGEICPVVDLPSDSSGLAVARIVYCQVSETAADDSSTRTFVTAVPNMTSTSLVDLRPANATDVCPNALVAPIVTYANFNAHEPKRTATWPADYMVRYAFKYTYTDKSGKVTESPDWSPWAVPRDPKGFEDGGDGYLHQSNYYSFQMLVPNKPGFGYRLLRQFKDKTGEQQAEEIATHVAAAKNQRMIFVEDATGP